MLTEYKSPSLSLQLIELIEEAVGTPLLDPIVTDSDDRPRDPAGLSTSAPSRRLIGGDARPEYVASKGWVICDWCDPSRLLLRGVSSFCGRNCMHGVIDG